MPPPRARYDPHQATVKASKSLPSALPPSTAAEAASPEYHIKPAWIDTAGRTRTWALKDPHGTQMAEITTKAAAIKLARLLSEVMPQGRAR